MAGRILRRKNDRQKSYKDAVTQTSPEKYIIERDRLQDENNLLRQELDRLKRKQQPNSSPQRQKEEVTVVAAADSPQLEKNPIKGCNCRGKCSSRVCGCVKKQITCTPACRCQNSKCQNQESDKENIGSQNAAADLSSEVEENTKLLSTLGLRRNREEQSTQGAAGTSNKQLDRAGTSRKGIFSPDTPRSRRQDFPLSKLQLNTPIKFGPTKKIVSFDSNSSLEERGKPDEKSVKIQPELPVKTAVQRNGKSKTEQAKKKRLIAPLHDGRRARAASLETADIDGVNSPVENEPVKEKEKVEKTKKVSTEITAASRENLQDIQIQENLDAELDLSTIDPMKPTRQLQRTPVLASPHKQSFRLSDLPLPYLQPVRMETRILVPPPEDIDSPQVDWDKHCAQLVPCRLCKRTFYPYRIEKHEASCKKI